MSAERSTDVPTLWAEIDRLKAEVARLKAQSTAGSSSIPLLADPPSRGELINDIQRCAIALSECDDPEKIAEKELDLAYAKLALEVYDERYSR